jgi:hypothetical protein
MGEFRVVTRLVLAMSVVAIMATSGLSQTPDHTEATRTSEEDSLRRARQAKLHELSKARKDTCTGWLILDGRLIPGPYDFVLEDDCIRINGLPYMAPTPPEPKREVPQHISDQHAASRGILNTFHNAVPKVGVDSARALALAYALSQSILDTAYFFSSDRLEIIPHGESWPGFIWLRPILDSPRSSEDVRNERLQHAVSDLKKWLNHGWLVLTRSRGGYLEARKPPRAGETVKELQRIAATVPDLQERIAAVKEIVHDDAMAEVIAREFERK